MVLKSKIVKNALTLSTLVVENFGEDFEIKLKMPKIFCVNIANLYT